MHILLTVGSETGSWWFLLRGPMRAIGPVQMDLGQEVMKASRSFKLQMKIAGSNNGETQATAFADESLWFARLVWSEMHGAPMRRWHLAEAVRQVGGMLITDSRGIFDALTRSESPQLRLRSSRTSEKARSIQEQCADSNARVHWVNTSTL